MRKEDLDLDALNVFADVMNIGGISANGVQLNFYQSPVAPLSRPGEPPAPPMLPQRVTTVRVTPQHLKQIAWVLYNNVRGAESQLGVIVMPENVLKGMGIDAAAWNQFWGLNNGPTGSTTPAPTEPQPAAAG